jgi:hypothetical protein
MRHVYACKIDSLNGSSVGVAVFFGQTKKRGRLTRDESFWRGSFFFRLSRIFLVIASKYSHDTETTYPFAS